MAQSSPKVAFTTLGCAKNEVDTDKMAASLLAAGFEVCQDLPCADLVVVNTCAFLMSACEESIDAVFQAIESQAGRDAPAKVIVAGCLASRYGDSLAEELTEADGFVACADEGSIVQVASRLLKLDYAKAPSGTGCLVQPHRCVGGPSAYVKISDGCSRFCTYCMIPYIRGAYRSFPEDEILAEISELVDSGTREIVLIGQDTGLWGRDLGSGQGRDLGRGQGRDSGSDHDRKPTIADLLETCAERFEDTWFRLMYLQPEGITDRLLDVMASNENICSYLDMPLQHANVRVLHAMHRQGSAEEYLEVLDHVRSRVPDIACRTTLMAGFPGETREEFEELLAFVDEARFDFAGVFAYSAEEGSAAATFDGQLDFEEKRARAQELLDACEAVGIAQAQRFVGRTLDVLVEGYETTDVGLEAVCRHKGQAPEVDGQVHVPIQSREGTPLGSMLRVHIVGSFFFELEGELVDCGQG